MFPPFLCVEFIAFFYYGMYFLNLISIYFQIIKMECQVKKTEHFRHLLLFALNQGSKAAKVACNICAIYGEDAIVERTARDWYAKFINETY